MGVQITLTDGTKRKLIEYDEVNTQIVTELTKRNLTADIQTEVTNQVQALNLTEAVKIEVEKQLSDIELEDLTKEPKTYVLTSPDEKLEDITDMAIGDFAIVKSLITNDKYSYTGYIYSKIAEDTFEWIAMDGNYNANNVYFDKDIMITTNIGYITTSNGSGTIPAEGKNLEQVFEAMFTKEQDPSKTDPSVSVSLTGAGSYEVGTKITGIKYTASFEDGNYSYGPEPTGAQPTKWEVTSTTGYSNTVTPEGDATTVATSLSNITLDDVIVADDTNFSVTAKATYTAGVTPKTNKGNNCADSSKTITAGTKSKKSSAITGYRSYFYGVLDTSTAEAPLTSALIRDNLTNGGAYNASTTFTLYGSATAKRIVIAIPGNSSRGGLSSVILTSAMNTPVTDSYIKTENAVDVEGVGGAKAIKYTVYVYEPSKIDAGEVHDITLA